MKLSQPLVIGNWKMHPQTDSKAKQLAGDIKKSLSRINAIDVVIAPPSVYLSTVASAFKTNRSFSLGAQNVHHEPLGSFTGEISIPMLKNYGVTHIILGHSERRKTGETDSEINLKLHAVIKAGLTGVVCVGEVKRDSGAQYLGDIERQIREAVKGVSRAKLGNVVVAYEPVWAIGTGNTATPHDVYEMKLFIEKTLADLYGRGYAQKVRILYGGSVNAKNTEELMRDGMVDGFLVGGSSLLAEEFTGIVRGVLRVCGV